MTAELILCSQRVDEALGRGEAQEAAAIAQEGLRATAYDDRKRFFLQLCGVLQRRAATADGAKSVAEAGEALWVLPEFRSVTAASASVSGETLLLAAAVAAAYMTLREYAKALAFDRELLQSPSFFTYDGFSALERLACVARVLEASRRSKESRYVDSAVHKGMSLYHSLAKSRTRLDEAGLRSRDAVVCAYLHELGCLRQTQGDYVRAFQSFAALHENNKRDDALRRAALCALCIRAAEGVRRAALHDVLHRGGPSALPELHRYVTMAYDGQLFRAADRAAVEAAASGVVETAVVRDALREHNILLLAGAFDCVHWRSLRTHMDDADMTEQELYDLLVEMVRARRTQASIHQDTGFIEFDTAEQQAITDADVFGRLASVSAMIADTRPDLLA